jgi:hypothetical protein
MTTWYGCTEALKTSPAAASSPNSDRIGKGIPGATMYRNARLTASSYCRRIFFCSIDRKIGAPASDMRLSTLYGYRENVIAGGLTRLWCRFALVLTQCRSPENIYFLGRPSAPARFLQMNVLGWHQSAGSRQRLHQSRRTLQAAVIPP